MRLADISDAPTPRCPGCDSEPSIVLTDQAFCPNDTCHVMMWNPRMTLDELAANADFNLELPDLP